MKKQTRKQKQQTTPYDGGHSPDGWTHEFCAACSRDRDSRVWWPCPAVERLREVARS
jgi:hypothetical protein